MSRRRGKSFLDTNIFVYTFDSSAPQKREKARFLVAQALDDRMGVISYQVVQEFLNVATRKFARPLSVSDALVYLDRVLMPLCEIFPEMSLYSRALATSASAGLSFYDALIVSAAAVADCTVLLTEDLPDGRSIGGIEIRNPFL
ncbi:MAG TPA: PIN domain-containing protein [Bryobacteraceae bacterium]|jgi:predicted nucleic acid-binding protein